MDQKVRETLTRIEIRENRVERIILLGNSSSMLLTEYMQGNWGIITQRT